MRENLVFHFAIFYEVDLLLLIIKNFELIYSALFTVKLPTKTSINEIQK